MGDKIIPQQKVHRQMLNKLLEQNNMETVDENADKFRTILMKDVPLIVGKENKRVDIGVNQDGNLIITNLPSVYYDMLDEEMSFSPATEEEEC